MNGFGADNLPYGIFSPPGAAPRVGTRIGDEVVDLSPLGAEWRQGTLNALMGMGRPVWETARMRVRDLAAFVSRCRELGVPFKGTAGLHHPVAAPGRHGYLNLLAAATFGDDEAALAETDAAAFALDDERFAWRDREAGPEELARVRRDVFVGFGSCSVAEPVDDLRVLGLL